MDSTMPIGLMGTEAVAFEVQCFVLTDRWALLLPHIKRKLWDQIIAKIIKVQMTADHKYQVEKYHIRHKGPHKRNIDKNVR